MKRFWLASLLMLTVLGCRDGSTDNDGPIDQRPKKNPDELEFTNMAAGVPIANLAQLGATLRTEDFHARGYHGQNSIVAVLDNGFGSLALAQGKTLPPNVYLSPTPAPLPNESTHGTNLAEIVYAVATGKDRYDPSIQGPELYLFRTYGPYQNLSNAIDQLVALKNRNPKRTVFALYSQIWEYGGNLNGTGYINDLVNRAIRAGIIWVNAAGNLGKSSYVKPIKLDANNNMILPYQEKYLRMSVAHTPTEIKLVLAWKDFSNSYYHYFTNQDLDLILETATGTEIARANLIQDGQDHNNAEGYSRHAREMMNITLAAGTYHIRVEAKTTNFPPDAIFWITATGADVQLEQNNGDQYVFMPADNADVLTVGAADADYGNMRVDEYKRVVKPDIVVPSTIYYANGLVIQGTSTAAAVAAGTLALFRSAAGDFTAFNLRNQLNSGFLSDGQQHDWDKFSRCQDNTKAPAEWQCDKYKTWNPLPLMLPRLNNYK